MNLNYSELEKYLELLRSKLIGKRINKIIYFSSSVFTFSISKNEYVMISLKGNNPFIATFQSQETFSSLNNSDVQQLKKELSNYQIIDIKIQENDRVLTFKLSGLNDVFKETNKYLVLELIPSRSNLIILDSNYKIIYSFRNPSDKRIFFKNMSYEYPVANPNFIKPVCRTEVFNFNDDIDANVVSRKNEVLKPVLDFIKKRLKISNNKITKINDDILKANNHLSDAEKGNQILMNISSISPKSKSFSIDNMIIELNPQLKPYENANLYFKNAKKAKETIELSKQNIERAQNEINYLENILKSLESLDLNSCLNLIKEFDLEKVMQKKQEIKISPANRPYFFKLNDTTVLFGKNSKQNDYLTWCVDTSKDHVWMHIVDEPGSHLIIKKSNPEDTLVNKCAQFLCFISGHQDGQVMVALHKDLKKGSNPGEVICSKFNLIRVNSIEEDVPDLLKISEKF